MLTQGAKLRSIQMPFCIPGICDVCQSALVGTLSIRYFPSSPVAIF